MMDDGIPRTVKPRDTTKAPAFYPIIAVDTDARQFLIERTGEVGPTAELHHHVLTEVPSIVVAENVAELVAGLDRTFGINPRWQYRAIPHRREIKRPGATRTPVIVSTVISFFGFKNDKKGKRGRWFYPIDPAVFCDSNIDQLLQGDEPRLVRLMEWARDVRQFCQAQRLTLTPTGGGLAGQLLRDPRFYPDARRKVPKKTNALARQFLPGNYYKLFAPENATIKRATYLDLRSAHHNAAAVIRFPHADHLFRRGDWFTTDPTDTTGVPWGPPRWEPGVPGFRDLLSKFMGLLCVRLRVPTMPPSSFPLPCLETPGLVSAYIYTNEIAYIKAAGASIEGVDAAWGSFKPDDGLNRYACWALAENATMSDERKRWAKSTLLATYGLLAARPKMMELAYRRMDGGVPAFLPAGGSVLPVNIKTLPESESKTVNVIHRGMIEAQTRMECLTMARTMTTYGHRVLSIYADAVIVEVDGSLPLLPAPWEVKAHLDGLVYFNATSFHSRQMTRLPGIPREGKERILRSQAIRSISGTGGNPSPVRSNR